MTLRSDMVVLNVRWLYLSPFFCFVSKGSRVVGTVVDFEEVRAEQHLPCFRLLGVLFHPLISSARVCLASPHNLQLTTT